MQDNEQSYHRPIIVDPVYASNLWACVYVILFINQNYCLYIGYGKTSVLVKEQKSIDVQYFLARPSGTFSLRTICFTACILLFIFQFESNYCLFEFQQHSKHALDFTVFKKMK